MKFAHLRERGGPSANYVTSQKNIRSLLPVGFFLLLFSAITLVTLFRHSFSVLRPLFRLTAKVQSVRVFFWFSPRVCLCIFFRCILLFSSFVCANKTIQLVADRIILSHLSEICVGHTHTRANLCQLALTWAIHAASFSMDICDFFVCC